MKLFSFFIFFISSMVIWSIFMSATPEPLPEIREVVVNPFVIENPDFVTKDVYHNVTVTVYHAVKSQTDNDPDTLADGTKIDVKKAGSYRYCALSRDLLERWGGPYSYGDIVHLDGAGKFSGAWIVKDTMNKRFKGRVDLLVDRSIRSGKFEDATLRKAM